MTLASSNSGYAIGTLTLREPVERSITLAQASVPTTEHKAPWLQSEASGSTSTAASQTLIQLSATDLPRSKHLSSDADYHGLYLFLAVAACMFIGRLVRS